MEKIMMLATKMSANRYLGAIRDAFIFAVPLTITAAFAVLINNVILANNLPYALTNPAYYSEGFIKTVTELKYIFDSMNYGALQILTLLIVFALAHILSTASKADNPLVNAMIVFGVFWVLMPKGMLITEDSPLILGNYTEAKNLFTALVVGILFTELLLKLQTIDALKITLPDSVPPAVANSFTALIPTAIVFLFSGILAYLFMKFRPLGYSDLSMFISGVFQAPFLALAKTSIGGWGIMFIYQFFASLLWVFGLHGPNILAGFREPTLGVLATENQTLYAQGIDPFSDELAIFTQSFTAAYSQYGGSGATLGLIIAVFIASKREDYKAISKLALMPGLFEINEPIIFGIPIVLNPIMAIPFVLAPCAAIILPGIMMQLHVIPKLVVAIPWVMPPVIGAFLATGANFGAALVAAANLVLITLIYLPFVLMANKQAEREAVIREEEQ